jgi:hypothetical protein
LRTESARTCETDDEKAADTKAVGKKADDKKAVDGSTTGDGARLG